MFTSSISPGILLNRRSHHRGDVGNDDQRSDKLAQISGLRHLDRVASDYDLKCPRNSAARKLIWRLLNSYFLKIAKFGSVRVEREARSVAAILVDADLRLLVFELLLDRRTF